MTESAYSSLRGAEISERSTELVLPSNAPSATSTDAPKPEDPSERVAASGWRTTLLVEPAASETVHAQPGRDPGKALSMTGASTASFASTTTTVSDATIGKAHGEAVGETSGEPRREMSGEAVNQSSTESPIPASPSERPASLAAEQTTREESGRALPGDRGPRDQPAGSPRPSFWRRIALGRRAQALRAAQLERPPLFPSREGEDDERTSDGRRPSAGTGRDALVASGRAGGDLVSRDPRALETRANEAIERRIVDPLLQALVSVEAKLERSHVDLIGRSDQVEQRLTQLWDIEEQLGALGDLQESVLQVTEQQRRLEAALVAQTRILRWLVGGIILALAVSAFCVAFFLRVAR